MPLPRGHPYKYASPASGNRRIIIPGTSASCTLSALSATGGTISWAQATNAAGYQWYVGTASGSGTISYGTVSGGSTVTTNFTVSLTASTNYYGWVRAYSSTGDFGAYTYSAAATWSSGGLYAFTTITFTNAGSSGVDGPILSACVSAYQASNAWVTNTAYFKMSSYRGYQQWTVPSSAPYTFVVAGAGRAAFTLAVPGGYGYGAVLTSTITLTQGDVINICVGQQGGNGSSGCGNGWGGSGGTFVVNSTTSTPLIIAGGGGGSTIYNSTTGNINASLTTSGKLDGSNHGAGGSGGYGGGGGFGCCCQAGGGGGYSSSGTSYSSGGGGGYINGLVGAGGSWSNNGGFGGGGAGYYPGGGGGGYSGGSGGGLNSCNCNDCQGGGGGGSYSSATITSSSVNINGMGYVQVTINSFGPPQTVTVSSTSNFIRTADVSWSGVYQAVSYTVSVYQNASNSTAGGTLLGTATTSNTSYTVTGLIFTVGYYAYATVYATNATPTNTAPTTSSTLLVVDTVPTNIVLTVNLTAQTATTTWSFVNHAVISYYTLNLYTNTTNSTSGATLITTITTPNLTYTFSSLSLVENNYLYVSISATGSLTTTTTVLSSIVQITYGLYSFSTITFTNCSAVGSSGPIKSACVSAYSGSNPWVSNTSFFNMTTQGFQLWTVPLTKNYTFAVAGAGSPTGSTGVIINFTLALTSGHIISIVVGQMGRTDYTSQGSGGSGGTFVVNNTTNTIIAVGGGAGGFGNATTSNNGASGAKGSAGGSGGGGGGCSSDGAAASGAGYSGNGSSCDGGGTAYSYTSGATGSAGTSGGLGLTEGGFGGGGGAFLNNTAGPFYRSGGGGGYSGGGGGGYNGGNANNFGGGGGSYINGSATGVTYGTNSGMGYVTVS